jgi:PAS domain S-box-containing protein
LKLFGYRKGELEGKNVSLLMPAPFSTRHSGYLRNYTTTGKAKILDSSRQVGLSSEAVLHLRNYKSACGCSHNVMKNHSSAE